MQKKHILVLSLLAAGIALELILMAGVLARRGNSERTLSTNSTSIARGENTNNPTGQPGEAAMLPPEGSPQLGDDMGGGTMPSFESEATPIFLSTVEGGSDPSTLGGGVSDGSGFDGSGYNSGDPSGSSGAGNPFIDPGNSGGGDVTSPFDFPDESYPVPPTQPAGPEEPWPTDVPAATEPPASAQPTTEPTQAAPPPATPTEPEPTFAGIPTNTPAPPEPTATNPPAQPTAPAPTATAQPVQPTAPAPTSAPNSPAGLVSVPADAPAIDGAGSDAAWASAPAVEIDVNGGANNGSTRITARSVYHDDTVYFLFTWADPTQSFLRFPWEKQADGSWKLLASPNRGLNDENVYYEDKLALLWPMRGMPDFSSTGCGTACHSGENPDAKPYGNMYTPSENSRADLWQWKSTRNAGQVDDEFMDSTRYSKDNPAAGVHADPDDGGGYRTNQNKDKSAPAYMPPNGGQKNGAPGFIMESEKANLDPRMFQPGERVPSVLVAPWKGDRGDIQAAWQYKDGRWTLELRRKLMTGSSYDVQFDDPDKVYAFGIAAFDNAQVRHAYQTSSISFRFQRK